MDTESENTMVDRKSGDHQPSAGGQETWQCASSPRPYAGGCHEAHDPGCEERDAGAPACHPDCRAVHGLRGVSLSGPREGGPAEAGPFAYVDHSALVPQRADHSLNSTVAILRAVVAAEIYRLSGQLPEWTRNGS